MPTQMVTCPRCKGKGDLVQNGVVTKCYACGGRGEIDERDSAWASQMGMKKEEPAAPAKKSTRATAGTSAPKRASIPRVTPAKLVDTSGKSQLHKDAADGYLKSVTQLVASGADVNARDAEARTPLHWPAMRGYTEIVQLLLEHGADPNAADKNGRTPLDMAKIGKHETIIALLREHGGEG